MLQRHSSPFRCSISLPPITWHATRNQIVPREWSALRFGYDVIQRQPLRIKLLPAVLANVSVPCVDVFPRQDANANWNPLVVSESDDAWQVDTRIDLSAIMLLDVSSTLNNERQSPTRRRDRHRLVTCVQD